MKNKQEAPAVFNKIYMLEACVADLKHIIPWSKEDFQV